MDQEGSISVRGEQRGYLEWRAMKERRPDHQPASHRMWVRACYGVDLPWPTPLRRRSLRVSQKAVVLILSCRYAPWPVTLQL